ncbi:MAG: hypothetical protein EPN91_06365 [Salinibacterium sp.]|nr:MAG: hypothetical protein EPN91_06365 [Salinibacterium sp.]
MTERKLRDEIRASALAAGFYMGGETLAIDFVDTIKLKANPVLDYFDNEELYREFWRIQRPVLPAGAVSEGVAPDREQAKQLRFAIRTLFEDALNASALDRSSLDVVNGFALRAASVPQLDATGHSRETVTGGGDALLGAVARSAIETVADFRACIRHCESERCSMMFFSASGHRAWCSATCGNRVRVARFAAQRSREADQRTS